MRILYLLAIIAPIYDALAAGTPGSPEDLDKQYRVNFATKDNGGCQGYEDLLRKSYGEAFSVAQTAQNSLNVILKTRPDETVDPAGFAKWGRIARVFTALFGAGEQTFRQRRNNVVIAVQDKFKAMQEDTEDNPQFGAFGPRASIYCSTSWFKVLRPTDEDPTDTQNPKRTISVTHPDVKAGVIYSIPDNKLQEISQDAVNLGDFCDPATGNLAFTLTAFSAITFCPQTLDGKTSVKLSITDEKNAIQENDPIGNHRTMAEMWTHEWNHLLSRGSDADAVGPQGQPKLGANGKPLKSYGWDNIVNLARFKPEVAQNTPDAYAIFGNCMFFDNFDWPTGKAVKFDV